MPKKIKKKKPKLKKKKSQPDDVPVQLGSVSNRTMVQQMASETLSPTASVRSGTTSRERVTKELVFCLDHVKNSTPHPPTPGSTILYTKEFSVKNSTPPI